MSSRYAARILGAALLILFAVSAVSALTEINYTADDTFTVPAGVTQITVELWGAGGSGGAGDKNGGTDLGGGGGAGGQYVTSNITVTAGQEFNITVAGTTAASSQTGADSTFWNGTGNLAVAKGGAGGQSASGTASGTGGLGSTVGGIGDTVFRGGDGSDGVDGTSSGSGGGGAGSGGAGGDASGTTAGTGTANNPGGDGGAGQTDKNGALNAGTTAGGGGAGKLSTGGAADGGAGYARITYEAPPDAPTGVSATDGTLNDRVTVTWTKSSGATGYHVYTNEDGLIASLGDVATYDHTSAPAGSITAGTASATDGTNRDNVTLSLAGESASNGATRTYYVVAENSAGNSSDSATDTGYRGVGSLTYQWQRSAADSDASYSNIGGATTDPYTDTGAPQTGEGRYYRAVLNADGATQQISSTDRGYVNVTPFFSNFDGATTDFTLEADLSAVTQPILEDATFGRIQWYATVDVRDQDFDTYVSIADNSIDVDSANLDTSLNSRAEIRFYGLTYPSEPVIFKDGDLCASPSCNVTSYSGGTLTADVDGFSEYTTADFTATPNQTWTVTAWVNIDDTSGTQYLIEGINLGLKLVNSTSDRMLMHLNSGSHEYTAYTAPGLLASQGWKHVAFVFRADDDYRRIYVNGVNETILGPNVDNTTVGLSSEFEIGTNASGIIDEVMIFKRALAESEIDAIYRAGLYPYRVNLTSLAEGNYTFVAYSVDEAGNYENTSTRTVTVSTSLDCQTISSPGTYTLSADVSSSGTCFTIDSSDVELDCAGFEVSYANSALGYGAIATPGSDNVTINRCSFNQSVWNPGSSAIHMNGTGNAVSNVTISDTNITTISQEAIGVFFENVTQADISNVTVDVDGLVADGMAFDGSLNIEIADYTTIVRGSSRGLEIGNTDNVTVTGWTINVTGENGNSGSVIYAYNGSKELSFDNLNAYVNASDGRMIDHQTGTETIITNTNLAMDDGTLGIRLFTSSSTNITNSTITVPAGVKPIDVDTSFSATATAINVTFNESSSAVSSSGGELHVGWYVDLYVNDTSGTPVIADVNYTDSGTASSLNPTPSATGLSTDGTGFLTNLILYEYSENSTSRYHHTNYTFNVSNASYPLLTTERNFSSNTQLSFTLDANGPTWSNNATNETAETPRYNENITMNVTLNDDADLGSYTFSWNDSGSWVNDSAVPISGTEFNLSVSKQVTRTRGDVIAWRVYFEDAGGNANVTDTFSFTVKNTPPPVPTLDSPADNESFLTNRTPRYNWTQAADVDGDPVTFRWYLALDETFSSIAGSNESVVSEFYDQQSALDFTTYWWRVSACDPEDCSENSTTFNFTVTSLISIELYNATPDFGNMSLGDVNDTTNDDPAPITVRNVGNIEANISMNASALWNSVALDTSYYQAKGRQSEIGAYEGLNTTYFDLATVLKRVMTNLGWEDAADEALIDLRVEAPLDEYPGTKNSTIRVIAS